MITRCSFRTGGRDGGHSLSRHRRSMCLALITGVLAGLVGQQLPVWADTTDPTTSLSPSFPVPMATLPSASSAVSAAPSASTVGLYTSQAATASSPATGPVWERLTPPTMPGLICPGVAYDDATGTAVMLDGEAALGGGQYHAVSQTWTFNGTTWTQMPSSSNGTMSQRYWPTLAYDGAHGKVLAFGGMWETPLYTNDACYEFSDASSGLLNDTWTWDGSTWIQASPATSPPGRYNAAMVYDAAIGKIVMFGGNTTFPPTCAVCEDSVAELNDTWEWDGTNWTQVFPATSPFKVWNPGHIMGYDPSTGTVVMYDGPLPENSGKTWIFDGTNWTGITAANEPAMSGAMAYDPALGGLVYVAPGYGTWLWNGVAKSWSLLSAQAGNVIPGPSGGTSEVLMRDTARNEDLYYSDDYGNGVTTNEMWAYDRPQAPLLSKTVDRGTNGLYTRGEVAAYTLTLGSTNFYNTQSPVSITDNLPATLAPVRNSVSLDGQACNATTTPSCVFNGNDLTVRGIGVSPTRTNTLVYQAVAVGVDRACSVVTNAASATNSVGTATASVPITVCDSGLGLERWWSFITRPAGPGATANVNVANGNLVLQQQDSTAVSARGRLAYVLRRTYNSQDGLLVSFPGSIGAGWILNVADAGDGVSDVSAAGLYVPTLETVATPLGVTLVDRDGTRHTFTPRALQVAQTVEDETIPSVGPLFRPHGLQLDPGYASVSIDTLYDAPAGVHLGLWRYIETSSGCSPLACTSRVLGYAAVRPDRARMEFTADGRQVDVADGNGNELRYAYESSPPAGVPFPRLLQVYEPRSCTLPLPSGCRRFTFSYPTAQTVAVVDPAGRTTTYHLDTAVPAHLTSVDNPDGTHLTYTYGGCGGTVNQLCSATDPRGNATRFSYGSVTLGQPRVTQITDRDGNVTDLTWSSSLLSANLNADTGTERQRFTGIDDTGRVGQIDEGTTSDVYQHHATFNWDTAGSPCVKPSGKVDNQLCGMTVGSLMTSGTPDQTTAYTYNDEGQVLTQSVATGNVTEGSLATTYGYHAQYFQADGSVATFDDAVAGSGQVASAGAPTGRTAPTTLFAISDRTQMLSPRGNAAGSSYGQFLTEYLVDDKSTVDPNLPPPSTGTCADPTNPVANTGNVCEVDAPPSGSNPVITRYTYDLYGQRATMTTPKAMAEGGTAPPSYAYVYYQDGDVDLSGNVWAGGWLKAVVDPYGRFVLFAYDRAGNVARTYDRNATAGHLVTDALSTFGSRYTQTLYGSGTTALSAPWRYLQSQTDPLGNQTAYTLDANGNGLTIRPPRGTTANAATYDVTQTFDANDNLLTHQTPVEAAKPTRYTYDQLNNRSTTTDPNGNLTVYTHDSVNRLSATVWTRAASGGSTPVPSACHASTLNDAPIALGQIVCSTTTSYDGEDNVIASQDGNHQSTTYTYDAAHRRLTQLTPRDSTSLESAWVYDADGNVTDVCPPNQFTLPSVCNASAIYGAHSTYDPAGQRLTVTTYRAAGGAADTTTTNYDADGNPIGVVDPNGHSITRAFDYTDRRLTETRQRDASTSETSNWQYDGAGNVTAVLMPGGRTTAYSYDADNRLIDTVLGASSAVASAAGPATPDGGANVRTRLGYDQDGHVVAVFDAGAFSTSASSPDASFMARRDYDPDGRPSAEYIPRYDGSTHSDVGPSTTQTAQCPTGVTPQQSVSGIPTWPAGVGVCTTRLQYDADGNVSRVTLPTSNGADNRYISYTYTNDNLLSTVCAPNPSGAATSCPGSTASPRVVTQTLYYDADGAPVESLDALSRGTVTTYTRDELVQSVQAPTGNSAHVTSYAYDANGNRTRVSDLIGQTTTTAYFSDNLVNSITDPAGDVTSYTYDPAGNRISVSPPSANAHDTNNVSGTPTTYTYTFDNLLASVTQPVSPDGSLRRERLYGYDAGGRKTSEQVVSTNALGQHVGDGGTYSFTYFPDDRLNTQVSSLGGTITSTYTPTGQPNSIVDPSEGNSTLSATYYLDDSPRTMDDGARTTQSDYDGTGAPVGMAMLVDGTATKYSTTYGYGDSEVPSSMTDTAVTVSGSTSWTYDAAGRVARETDANGQTAMPAFNADDTLASLTLATSGGATLARWQYVYDTDYRITQQQFSGSGASGTAQQSTFCYHYDAASRVDGFQQLSPGSACGTVASTISHDHDGNRVTYPDPNDPAHGVTQYTYNADDSIATQKPANFITPQLLTYSPAGDLLTDGCISNAYDGFHRLTQYVSSGTTNCPAAVTKTFAYDGLDRQRAAGTTTLHYAGLGPAVALETNGTTDTAYELGPDGFAKAAAAENGSPAPHYLTDDGHGNIATATTGAQAVACTVRFDAYGIPISPASSTNPCNTGSTISDTFFAGSRRDATTGRYQFGSRTYDPTKASFLTPDSYRTQQSAADLSVGVDPLTLNRYNYVNGDPVNLIDPDGHGVECNLGPDCQELQTSYSGSSSGASTATTSSGGGGSTSRHSVAATIAAAHAPGINADASWTYLEQLEPGWWRHHATPSGFNFAQFCQVTCTLPDDTPSFIPSGGLCDWCGDVLGFVGGVAKGAAEGTVNIAKGALQGAKCALDYGPALCAAKTAFAVGSAAAQHPGDFFGGLVDWNDFSHGRIAEGIGNLLPTLALTAASGGAGAAGKGAEIAARAGEAATDGISSVEDVLANPALLRGQGPASVRATLGESPGWQEQVLRRGAHAGQGWVLREYDANGNLTGRLIRWHPGGGHHGDFPYWRVSSPEGGKSDIIPSGPDDLGYSYDEGEAR